MSARKPVNTAKYDAINLEWARRVLADPLAEHRIGIGLVKVARMVVERMAAENKDGEKCLKQVDE